MSHTIANNPRVLIVQIGVVGLFAAAVFYQARVQTWGSSAILDEAIKKKRLEITTTEYARRGTIFFADGKPAGQDEDTQEFSVDLAKVPQNRAFYMDLSMASGIAASEFEQLRVAKVKVKSWSKPMSREQSLRINDVRRRWRADGISLVRAGRRQYELGAFASGFLGVVRDRQAISGLEMSKNSILAGKNGQTIGLTDRTGAYLPMRKSDKSTKAVDGKNITLTIDSTLQQATTAALRTVVEANRADSGVAIVIDPQNGDILAMANWPSFDPGAKAQKFNPCYTKQLEPGSTFKILTLAKALDENVITMNTPVTCTGSLRIGKRSAIHCDAHGGPGAHGVVTPVPALAKSCNVAAATWARAIGYSDMIEYLRSLGVFKASQLGLPYEKAGQFYFGETAKQLQLANVGFGQSITVTPVLLAGAMTMIGNEGIRVEPRLIKKIGTVEQPVKPGVQIISARAARQTMQCMEAVIQTKEGTGARMKIAGYRLAGKTGTAQKMNEQNIKTGKKQYVANFVGFVPAPKPRAMVLVMVDNPKAGQIYGALVAGPVFLEIAKAVIHRYGIAPNAAVEAPATKPKQPIKIPKSKDKHAINRTV